MRRLGAVAVAVGLAAGCAGKRVAVGAGGDQRSGVATVREVASELEAQFQAAARDTSAWPVVTDEDLKQASERNRRWLSMLERVDPDALIGTPEWALRANLLDRARNQLDQRVCRSELSALSTFGGWHLAVADLARTARTDSDSARSRLFARMAALPGRIGWDIRRLEQGLAEGFTVPAPVVNAVLGQLEALTPVDPLQSPLDGPARRDSSVAPRWRAMVRDTLYPRIAEFSRFLREHYLPGARPDGSLATMKAGPACYRTLLRTIAGRDLDPAAVMADARVMLDSLRRALGPSARRITGTDDLDRAIRLLREDPRFTVTDRDSLLGLYRAAMERAKATMPAFFSRVTTVPVVVEPHGPAQERAGYPAQYSGAPQDRSRPARVFVNLARPDLMTVGLAVAHEGFPGHHQERALQSELPRPHPVVARLYNSGLSEGWGLYSEWLADTMGIYRDELERVGYQIHLTDAAVGVILDIGYHVFGWSRAALIDTMMATSGRSRALAEAYADRHAATPSQIATYFIGYRAITGARARAASALGPRFDLKAFHDAVLLEGTMPLTALDARVDRWIRERRRSGV